MVSEPRIRVSLEVRCFLFINQDGEAGLQLAVGPSPINVGYRHIRQDPGRCYLSDFTVTVEDPEPDPGHNPVTAAPVDNHEVVVIVYFEDGSSQRRDLSSTISDQQPRHLNGWTPGQAILKLILFLQELFDLVKIPFLSLPTIPEVLAEFGQRTLLGPQTFIEALILVLEDLDPGLELGPPDPQFDHFFLKLAPAGFNDPDLISEIVEFP